MDCKDFFNKYRYKNFPLFRKFFVIIMLLMIIFLLVVFIYFQQLQSIRLSGAADRVSSNSQAILAMLDSELESIAANTKLPGFSSGGRLMDCLIRTRSTNTLSVKDGRELSGYLDESLLMNRVISRASIIWSPDFYLSRYSSENYIPNPAQLSVLYQNAAALKGALYISKPYQAVSADTGATRAFFSLARAIRSLTNEQIICVVCLDVDLSILSNLCSRARMSDSVRILIVDDAQLVLYDTLGSQILKALPAALSVGEGNEHLFQYEDQRSINYALKSAPSPLTGWQVIHILTQDYLTRYLQFPVIDLAGLCLTGLFISLLLAYFLSKAIMRPVRALTESIAEVKKGRFDTPILVDTQDEIGTLASSFRDMQNQLSLLIDESIANKMTQKDLQIKMLQNQINPHFIYNTLESIRMMAILNDDQDTANMTVALGRFLRYSISTKQLYISVQDEIDALRQYLYLQDIMFHDQFTVVLNIDEKIFPYMTIKLILQPIIENAIYHAFKNTESGGIISVSGKQDGNSLVFIVRDNGSGMTAGQTAELNAYINNRSNSQHGIGIKNINERIKLYYGEAYGVHIQSVLNEGTSVRITIPVIFREEQRV